MVFQKRRSASAVRGRPASAQSTGGAAAGATTRARGERAEQLACDYLTARGLRLLHTNFRTPGRGGGEIDLIMVDTDGTLVFVEVRQRKRATQGGAAASIGATKQRRIVFAARHYLLRLPSPPLCRFDAVLLDGDPPAITWLRAAFDAA
ncbi:MAG: hypothetical protein GAK30_03787 [Paracidovorax wautersii]|uniref:UPF0102 protein GAK30_03787 n=1 Tax=Paracidovorax wautersii TaxID=1177982 RepID=A0A7V8FKL9_9BURK|nr:MAG: hypothetical protein GAK30_03787 [Paracidovorax wautersii]